MANKVLVVSVGLVLGLISFGAGFGAEVTRAKASEIAALSRYECVYPESPAMALGITAAVSLFVAQVIVNVATGCFCCKRNGRSSCQLRVFCTISWIAFFMAGRMFLSGAAINDGMVNGNDESQFGYLQCYYVKPGVFAGGAVLSAVSVVLAIFYFLGVSKLESEVQTLANHEGGIPMATPQFHASKDPTFPQV